MLDEAEKMFATGRIHAVSITDCPGGNPALESETYAEDMAARGITLIDTPQGTTYKKA